MNVFETGARLLFAMLAALALAPGQASADEPAVPVPLQMDLLAKVASYDRNLPSRAGDRVVTAVVVKDGNPDSARAAAQAQRALRTHAEVAGLPHAVETLTFSTPKALAEACQARRCSVVYLTPGFAPAEVAAVGQALEGTSVLTVSAEPAMVGKGVVLGFDLVAGKPKLLVALAQAAKHSVALSANVLKLMTVIP